MNPREKDVLSRFAATAQKEYGDRLLGLYAFDYLFDEGVQDDELSVDADVAVILADGDWRFLEEKKRLVRLTFDILLDTQVYVRAWPLPASAWRDPSTYGNPTLVRQIKRHSEPIMEAVAVGWVERQRRPNIATIDPRGVGSSLRSTQPTIERVP